MMKKLEGVHIRAAYRMAKDVFEEVELHPIEHYIRERRNSFIESQPDLYMHFVRVRKGDLGPATTVNGGGTKRCVLAKKTRGYIMNEWIDKGCIKCVYINSLLIILGKMSNPP